MDPMTFMSRLAAQVPPPRFHLLSYYGVLAPAASRREEIVPPRPAEDEDESSSCSAKVKDGDELRRSRHKRQHPERVSWSELLKRVFLFDILHCPCGGKREVLAMVFDSVSIRRILKHQGLPHQPPARSPPRAIAVGLPY